MSSYDRITAAILAALETETPAWRRPWRTLRAQGAATLPRNAHSGRSYRGINVALLAALPFADQRYVTFRQALELGGHVRRGEHGYPVVFWQRRPYKATSEQGQEEERMGFLLRVYTVFNVSQCDGITLPAAEDLPAPVEAPELMRRVYAATGARVMHEGDAACYVPMFDSIRLPVVAAFDDADAYAATAFHELGHWTGATHRLDRDLSGRFGSESYAAEELVAELTAAYLCAEFGINQSLDHHTSYIAHWRKLLSGDSRAIITAASKAQAAADYIRNLVNPEDRSAEEDDTEAA